MCTLRCQGNAGARARLPRMPRKLGQRRPLCRLGPAAATALDRPPRTVQAPPAALVGLLSGGQALCCWPGRRCAATGVRAYACWRASVKSRAQRAGRTTGVRRALGLGLMLFPHWAARRAHQPVMVRADSRARTLACNMPASIHVSALFRCRLQRSGGASPALIQCMRRPCASVAQPGWKPCISYVRPPGRSLRSRPCEMCARTNFTHEAPDTHSARPRACQLIDTYRAGPIKPISE
jgi:hypothetical protein